MKYSTLIVVLTAAAAQAAAVNQHAPAKGYKNEEWKQVFSGGLGHCNAPGQDCSITKRAALAVANAIAEPVADPKKKKLHGGTIDFCGVPGASCNFKRALDNIGVAAEKAHAAIWAREAAAEAVADPKRKPPGITFCGPIGASCNFKRHADAAADAYAKKKKKLHGGTIDFCGAPGASCNFKREAAPVAGDVGFCGVGGSYCNLKRDAAPDAKKKKLHGGTIGFCGAPGASCNFKREAEADAKKRPPPGITFCGALGSSCNFKRDAMAEAAPRKPPGITFCGPIGASCNFKREAVAAADAYAKKKKLHGGTIDFCGVPGASCNFKRQEDAAIANENSTDVEASADVTELDQSALRAACFAEGGECNRILLARAALEDVKRTESQFTDASASTSLAVCQEGDDCTEASVLHLQAATTGADAAMAAEEECDGPDGACTLAKRALEELEDAIDAGLVSLQEV